MTATTPTTVPNASSLTLPISTNNSPSVVEQITQPPPVGEDPHSPMGAARYYNECDLIVTTTATNVTVKAGNWDSFGTVAPDTLATNGSTGYSFIQTNASFYDAREQKWTLTTDLNVGALTNWMNAASGGKSLNQLASSVEGHQLNSIYVYDQRVSSGKLTVARVSNGQTLPPSGLTVATDLPLYVKGQFNAPDTTPGSTNTTGTLHYSGGVENFPRFLENWSGYTFTYNGSMVVMYPSQFATNYWVQTGTYYNAPNRKWAFDVNFLDYRRLPPATPQVRQLVRGQWNVVAGQ